MIDTLTTLGTIRRQVGLFNSSDGPVYSLRFRELTLIACVTITIVEKLKIREKNAKMGMLKNDSTLADLLDARIKR